MLMVREHDESGKRRQSAGDLALDIGFALAQSKLAAKGPRRIEECRRVAAAIVGHLKQCRWVWRRLPPPDLHGDSNPKSEEL